MKSYILSWYGITDLRAALGFEETGGPVLGALKTGDYTDVLLLAYTDPSKSGREINDSQKWWQERLGTNSTDRVRLSRQEEFAAVDVFANTPEAHQIYKSWLKRELRRLNLVVNVRLCVKNLKHLNDARGIYDAAIDALNIVSSQTEDRQVTLYLSPGTPVMAFTWAFVSLVNPELNIQVIASSDFRKPPENVTIPHELLAPSSRSQKVLSQSDEPEFDVVFHLFGEQRMPSLLGILQFPAKRHIFVNSGKYPACVMGQFLPKGSWTELPVNPFDPMDTKVRVLGEIATLPPGSRVGFNLTGGTKLMFAGAIAACRKIGGVPFYFETHNHSLVFLHDFRSMPIRGVDNLDLFFQASGFAVLRQGKWQDNPLRQQRVHLTRELWKRRRLIAKTYRELSQYTEDEVSCPFSIRQSYYERGTEAVVEIALDVRGRAYLNLDGAEFTFNHCPDFAHYLVGGWLEEYTYLLLEPLLKDGLIRDLRIGLTVTWDKLHVGNDVQPIQEFDITLTDGKRLFILECKAGAILVDHVYKLQQCVRGYGGIDARGIMVSAFPPHSPLTRKRLENAGNTSAFYGWDVTNFLANHIIDELSR